MAFENEKKRISARKELSHCAVHFTEDSFRENLAIRRFLGSDFKPLRLHLKEDAVPRTIFLLLFVKEITGKNVFRSTKTPLSVRLLLNEGS